jgi:NAD(P)-dependent dehydrogenase (short-subunit alcohol dehydrogenase family)
MDLGLRGKVAVITGGSIGLAVAEGLATEGAHPVATCSAGPTHFVDGGMLRTV